MSSQQSSSYYNSYLSTPSYPPSTPPKTPGAPHMKTVPLPPVQDDKYFQQVPTPPSSPKPTGLKHQPQQAALKPSYYTSSRR